MCEITCVMVVARHIRGSCRRHREGEALPRRPLPAHAVIWQVCRRVVSLRFIAHSRSAFAGCTGSLLSESAPAITEPTVHCFSEAETAAQACCRIQPALSRRKRVCDDAATNHIGSATSAVYSHSLIVTCLFQYPPRRIASTVVYAH